ncbi:bifunctional phosphopantothenoylcysteine decarboxylase/phosphopantothenate synthase [Sphingomonas sp. LY54]|uniref:bifunctional phosphopantothenoylcysteine decarboxylase/phosphopantothenate synthase n=1 Tax=Sphingomonas sp. LY54 TaxID=3095343 RepID=UPI002D789CC7|nr:bifunctional phosphopantothenoylcysteine decarboxylase/phosphopantothenate synthase [Sphingomonas sp. LY54]WRP28606.1 bifunctional phosphopantothenoylcysteine decarboxylase/phosphopantothenate synthase [Sphingomonas sp. LY54]
MQGKSILLIIGGGIAAYKSAELIRLIRKAGGAVTCVLTKSGAQFVTEMTLGALSENKVYTNLFDLKDEVEMGHIQLSRQADLVVVCPATADLLAKMAAGIADDLATTLLLATDKAVLAAPAMNVRMWQHAATQRNVAQLRRDGVTVLEPDEGEMACGEYGPGRLPEPEAILKAIAAILPGTGRGTVRSTVEGSAPGSEQPLHQPSAGPPPRSGEDLRLAGRHVIVTAGPTQEPIDPVRVIANRSSGKQGFALAGALADLGARVTLVAGPVALPTPAGVDRVDVETARAMQQAVNGALPADAAVLVAAVADWRVEAAPIKLKKADGPPALVWSANPDILATLAASPNRPGLLVGFAAETGNVVAEAQAKRARKGCDWIVANDVSGDVMGGDANQVHLITADGVESWDRASKQDVARRLADRISNALDTH